jgi:hypothetical protein
MVNMDEILKRYYETKEPVPFFLLLKMAWSVDS